MTDAVYKKIELVGTSGASIEEAIRTAVAHAAKTDKIDWVEIVETRAAVKDGAVVQFQVVLKAGCRVE